MYDLLFTHHERSMVVVTCHVKFFVLLRDRCALLTVVILYSGFENLVLLSDFHIFKVPKRQNVSFLKHSILVIEKVFMVMPFMIYTFLCM